MFELTKIKDAYLETQRDQRAKELTDLAGVDEFVVTETKKELDTLQLFIEQLFATRFRELLFMIDDQRAATNFENQLKENVKLIISTTILKQELTNFKSLDVW
jgi:glycosylphosphatidylinositol transamidase (GPIT) subunit GPI8